MSPELLRFHNRRLTEDNEALRSKLRGKSSDLYALAERRGRRVVELEDQLARLSEGAPDPAAGAELARLRDVERDHKHCWALAPSEKGMTVGQVLERGIAALRAQLATAEETAKRCELGFKFEQAAKVAAQADAAQAEARVKELETRLENRDAEVRFEMERADNSHKLRKEAEARLRAVTEAADAMRAEFLAYWNSPAVKTIIARYDASKSGRLTAATSARTAPGEV